MKLVAVQSFVVLLLLAGPARGQTFNCSPTLPSIYASTPDSTTQVNANFQALERALSCLENALAVSQTDLRQAEQNILDLRRQINARSYDPDRAERVTVRACSAGTDVVFLPVGLPCASMGPTYQDEQSSLPSYEVMVPR